MMLFRSREDTKTIDLPPLERYTPLPILHVSLFLFVNDAIENDQRSWQQFMTLRDFGGVS